MKNKNQLILSQIVAYLLDVKFILMIVAVLGVNLFIHAGSFLYEFICFYVIWELLKIASDSLSKRLNK